MRTLLCLILLVCILTGPAAFAQSKPEDIPGITITDEMMITEETGDDSFLLKIWNQSGIEISYLRFDFYVGDEYKAMVASCPDEGEDFYRIPYEPEATDELRNLRIECSYGISDLSPEEALLQLMMGNPAEEHPVDLGNLRPKSGQVCRMVLALDGDYAWMIEMDISESSNQPLFATINEAVEAAGDLWAIDSDENWMVLVMEKDGKYLRAAIMLDNHAKELRKAALTAEDVGTASAAFNAYAWNLPVTYTEEFTAMPKEQTELDALAGKTIREIIDEGYNFIYVSDDTEDASILFTLAYGLYNYDFEIDVTLDEYQECREKGNLTDLAVKNGVFSGFSPFATDLFCRADGTYE